LVCLFFLSVSGGEILAQDTANPCNWEPGGPHKMHWPQLPDFSPEGMDIDAMGTILADDFKCTATGPISRIHIWASFADDVLPSDGPESLTLSLTIFSDIPATENSWSRPGERLWTRLFKPGEYTVRPVYDGPEGWYDPVPNIYLPKNHRLAYQYSFCIDRDQAWVQQAGAVYWLALEVQGAANAASRFGWKTTSPEFRWNDDAVYRPVGAGWLPLKYPQGSEYAGQTLDLAFVIDGDQEVIPECDLGDAPDSTNSYPGASMLAYPSGVLASFPTVYKAGSPPYGPLHREPKAAVYLGACVSGETEADFGPDEDPGNNLRPATDAADMDACDDGVLLPLTLPQLEKTTFEYVVTVTPGAPDRTYYVNVWIDWNRDGDWEDWDVHATPVGTLWFVDEWAVSDQEIHLGPGTYVVSTPEFLCWHPPDMETEPLWMRITIAEQRTNITPRIVGATSDGNGSGPEGGYQYGETEDYLIYPQETPPEPAYDWGDAPDGYAAPGYPTLSGNKGAHHLATGPWFGDNLGMPDTEVDGQPDADAQGDDTDGNDDEEGVWIPALVPGDVAVVSLKVGGGGGVVQGWIDFDGDMVWQAAEKVFDGFLPDGAHSVNVVVPTTAVPGKTFARFRISRNGGLSPAGPAPDGEVEDCVVPIRVPPANDKWIQWPDLTPNGIDIHAEANAPLADDFPCTSENRITEIYLWGSWKHDESGKIEKIHVSIHPDDPVGLGGSDPENRFSKPEAEVLWSRSFVAGEFKESLYHVVAEPGEWWWDPADGELIRGGDTEVWRLDLEVPPQEAFLQQGSPDNPVIYWLKVVFETSEGQFGWKTRRWPQHYMDDAVWDKGAAGMEELRYPKGHPYYASDRNSIDMAFQLGYTAEVVEYPTMRPGSVTQCPAVETQCPVIETRCPPVETECPGVDTRCPMVRTKCPATATRCPMVATSCPIVLTKCPTEPTRCPAVLTKCPMVQTRCPVTETSCPPVRTKCPAAETKCPPVQTKCPPTATECTVVQTQCPAVETECPPVETKCPPVLTKCPVVQTRCPATDTKCPPLDTKCPPVETKCPPVETQCPPIDTKCPPAPTVCPAVDTRCPAVETKCPPVLTKCPPTPTECVAVQTQCPPVETQCPPAETKCPPLQTLCPPIETKCPATDTKCPPVETKCPPTETKCPLAETKCPAVATKCPPVDTRCPGVYTRCPPIDTQCPTTSTKCPPTPTECAVVQTQCPAVETECPPAETKCPPVTTKCPVVDTRCPAESTRCPPIDTQCPTTSTKCPPTPTECAVVQTQCPAFETRCPSVQTKCPMVQTQCPTVATECPAAETQCPVFVTRCPPVQTQCVGCLVLPTPLRRIAACPAIDAICPSVVVMGPPARIAVAARR